MSFRLRQVQQNESKLKEVLTSKTFSGFIAGTLHSIGFNPSEENVQMVALTVGKIASQQTTAIEADKLYGQLMDPNGEHKPLLENAWQRFKNWLAGLWRSQQQPPQQSWRRTALKKWLIPGLALGALFLGALSLAGVIVF